MSDLRPQILSSSSLLLVEEQADGYVEAYREAAPDCAAPITEEAMWLSTTEEDTESDWWL